MNRPIKVLIVEDSEDDTLLALGALRRGGFEVTHERVDRACAMQAALARPGWDAVISDYNMPGLTGLDALEILKGSGLDLPFILVSGTVGEEIAVRAMKLGAGDYVMKQSLARLAPALERELQEAAERAAARRAERKLRDSEARFRSLTELSSDWYWEQDADLRFVNFSGADQLRGWGTANASALGLRRWEVPNSVPPGGSWDEHKALLEARKPFYNFEFQHILHDVQRGHVSVSGEPFFDADGGFAGYRGVATDITERKQAELAHAQLAAIVEHSNDAIISRGLDGNILSWNAAAERMLGYSAAEATSNR